MLQVFPEHRGSLDQLDQRDLQAMAESREDWAAMEPKEPGESRERKEHLANQEHMCVGLMEMLLSCVSACAVFYMYVTPSPPLSLSSLSSL